MIDKYYIRARLFPTVITSIPVLVLFNKVVAPLYQDGLENVFATLPLITSVIFSTAIVFLLIQINRLLAKEIFQHFYFQDELAMPTTEYLLHRSSILAPKIKEKLYEKIRLKFNISLMGAQAEAADEMEARKLIVTCVSQIRVLLRDNRLLLQHNIEYGFFRNLVGGSVLAFITSVILVIIGYATHYYGLRIISLCLTIIYSLPLIFSSFFIRRYGSYYAKILLEQFLSV